MTTVADVVKQYIFSRFVCPFGEIVRRPAAASLPLTHHTAHLNHYIPKFSGVPKKLTRWQMFGLQLLPK